MSDDPELLSELIFTTRTYLDNRLGNMNGLMSSGKGATNALSQLGNREGIDRSLFQVSRQKSEAVKQVLMCRTVTLVLQQVLPEAPTSRTSRIIKRSTDLSHSIYPTYLRRYRSLHRSISQPTGTEPTNTSDLIKLRPDRPSLRNTNNGQVHPRERIGQRVIARKAKGG